MFSYMKQEKGFYRHFFSLAFPLIIQNLLSWTLSFADSLIVGSLGETAIAAVTLYNIPARIVWMFSFGAQNGTAILVSQYWGKKDMKSINKVLGIGLYGVMIVSAVFCLIMFTIPEQFISLFGNDPEIISMAVEYGQISSVATLINNFNLIYLSVLRSVEEPRFGTVLLGFSMVFNIVFDYAFINGFWFIPKMGIAGAAWATLAVKIIEITAIIFNILFNKKFRVIPGCVLRPGFEILKGYLINAGLVITDETLWGSGTSAFSNVMSHMQDSTALLSASSVSGNIDYALTCFELGISSAAAVVIGKMVGEGQDKEKIKKAGYALITVSTLTGVLTGLLLLLAEGSIGVSWLYPLFGLSGLSAQYCSMMVRTVCWIIPLKNYNNTMVTGVLRGGGDTTVSTMIDLLPLWAVAVPYCYIVGFLLNGSAFWVYFANAVQYLIQTLVGAIRIRSDSWIKDITVHPAEEE